MSSQRETETPALVLSMLITLGVVVAGLWWSADHLKMAHLLSVSSQPRPTEPDGLSPNEVLGRISSGERLLIQPGASPEKHQGVQAIAAGNSRQAVAYFAAALQSTPNDPEALIYLNNAQIGPNPAYAIAVSVPLSQDLNSSLEVLRGVAQAQQEINQSSGIGGMPLRVIIANDENRPAVARAIAQALVANPSVLGVVGHASSEATLAAAEIYEAGKLVAISPLSTAVELAHAGAYTYRTVPSDFVTARALADHLLNQMRQQKAAVFFDSRSRYSQSLKAEFGTALSLGGGLVVREIDVSQSTFSAADSIQQATAQGATALVLLTDGDQLDRTLQVVRTNGGRLPLLAGGDVYAPKTLEVGGPESVGMVVAVPWHILSASQAAFVERSRQLWRGDVNWRTATAYDAAQTLIAALEQAPNRAGVQQALRSPNFFASGATGTVRFLPTGDRNQGVQLVTVQPGLRSGFGFDFVPLGHALPAAVPAPVPQPVPQPAPVSIPISAPSPAPHPFPVPAPPSNPIETPAPDAPPAPNAVG
ncbi:ABC transporter substrate-binding protein [Leptolyngbya sp. O-77]|uniref:ABC transporter substrate-binding protein n=1 Tax=Leptolyngbya sp. O-77 TaxID=1080068 RepID=UPI00074D4B7B|nr:ABC transporter substrate-binding protein [Leptolyngbya sp. O-77]BAU42628.1 Leucine-specific-binding protein precursor [Leptolyngbya sp. O-77]